MLFFIGESIGWQELLLIGVLALIFLGPRKLPQVAKTVGKAMAELRRAGQEFKRTWENEIALEEDEKKFLQSPFDENLILAEERYSKIGHREDTSKFNRSGSLETGEGAKTSSSQGIFVKKTESTKKEMTDSMDNLGVNLDKSEMDANSKQHWL